MCPFTSLLGLTAIASGSRDLFVLDRRYRLLAWASAGALALGWAAYFVALRHPGTRIALEVLSVAALVVAVLRARWLVKNGVVRPSRLGAGALLSYLLRAIRSPWVALTKGFLLAMIALAALGRASFAGWEYAVVSGLLVVLIVIEGRRGRQPDRFATLASFGEASAPAPECPLGFGAETSTNAGTER